MTLGGRPTEQKPQEVCADMSTPLALAHRAPVAKRARKGTLLEGVEDSTKGFGPLKVILGGIPPLYADHEVRLKPSAQTSLLANTLAEGHRCEQQDQEPPLARSFFGRMFQFASD